MPAQPQLDTTLSGSCRKARRILEREGTVAAGALARRLGRSQRHVRRLVQQLDAINRAVEMSEDEDYAFRGMDHETRVDMQQDIKRYRNNVSNP